ncbi:hypothetical protein [Brachybacterium sp. GPGPB12]|uniref:hypothetical protein n=1 Tax=Brachybacterium sp. GPGPB12 TaxID=3023517 RepID=UPI003134457F
MTTTDTDALTERLTEAVRETLLDDHGAGSDLAYVSWDGEQWLAVEGGIDLPHLIAAVLPIVAVEVRKAKAEALRDAAEDVTEIDGRRDDSAANWLRARATEYEAGGSDEHR